MSGNLHRSQHSQRKTRTVIDGSEWPSLRVKLQGVLSVRGFPQYYENYFRAQLGSHSKHWR